MVLVVIPEKRVSFRLSECPVKSPSIFQGERLAVDARVLGPFGE